MCLGIGTRQSGDIAHDVTHEPILYVGKAAAGDWMESYQTFQENCITAFFLFNFPKRTFGKKVITKTFLPQWFNPWDWLHNAGYGFVPFVHASTEVLGNSYLNHGLTIKN